MWQNFPLWPTQASTMASRVDALVLFLTVVSAFFIILIFAFIALFAFRYRRSKRKVTEQVGGSNALELTWTLIPFALTMVMFVWGASLYMAEAQPPKDAMQIFVVGKQWMWKVQHPEGQREIDQLHVPVNRDVRLTMISQDVVHDFFIPEFRIKMDVLPGRYTTLWFRATKPGTYHLFCSQYCGTGHSGMVGQVVVMTPEDFQAWLAFGGSEGSMASTGQKLFQQLGCSSCHRSDTQGRGPNLSGVYGRAVLLSNGTRLVADDNYVRESILNPGAKIVAGFQPIMPTFEGIVSEEQLISLVAYVKSLAQPQQREPVSNRPPVPAEAPKGAGGAVPKTQR